MTKNLRIAILVTVLLLLIAGSIRWRIPELNTRKQSTPVRVIDMYFEEFKNTSFDALGKQKAVLQAPQLERYSDGETLYIQQPIITFAHKLTPWRVTADTAEANKLDEQLTLHDNVVMQQGDNVYINMAVLLIDHKAQSAYSDSPVEIQHDGSKTHAEGLKADFISQKLTLQSKVKTRYVPPTKP